MKRVLYLSMFILFVPSVHAALPGDSARGKQLHQENCTKCHDSSVYTRKGRRVHSLDALKEQLEACGHAANKKFSSAQKQDLVKYLNDQFYRFK